MSSDIINSKIIGVGFQKTGTSTLRESLKILGFSVKDTTPNILIPILRGRYNWILKILSRYDAAEDTPWYMIYKELDRRIPNCKFILTIRDEESWYKSVSKHIGDLRSPLHEYVYGRGKGLPKDNKKNTIKVYSNHNKEVIEYFKDRPNDLLIIDFTTGEKWDSLCKFLGKPIPEIDFPHVNKVNYSKPKVNQSIKKKIKVLRKRIKYYLKIKYIDILNLWPKGE